MLAVAGAILAGVLTAASPCVLSVLPVVVLGSATGSGRSAGLRRAGVVTASLGVSVVVFTLALKATTALVAVPAATWPIMTAVLLVSLGLVTAFPPLWDAISVRVGLQAASAAGLAGANRRGGDLGAVLTGAALGPVFTSCSPLYGYLVVTAIPAEPAFGAALLAGYAVGLCLALLLLAIAGQRMVGRLGWAANPHGLFRRVVGGLFVVVGLAVATGLDRDAQTWLVEHVPAAPLLWGIDVSG